MGCIEVIEGLPEAIEVDQYLDRLFPIPRSLTGNGNRKTLRILQQIVPLKVIEYPSGTSVYDWTIPDEWQIRDAWIADSRGQKLIDWKSCNLHVVGYSESIQKRMLFEELDPKLHYLENNADAIPYRTSYYNRDWGFCVTANQYRALAQVKDQMEVVIDSDFDSGGSMTIGELLISGRRRDELLVSTYICHPSMANDNLSGMLTTAFLARVIMSSGIPEFSWRFIFVPETIGAIAYLKHNEDAMKRITGGFVVTCCGGSGSLGYKETFIGNHIVDRAVRLAFKEQGIEPIRYPFVPDGSDERQYSSPGFRIPVSTITKDKYYEYPQYHTSLDNLDFVNGDQVLQSLSLYLHAVGILDSNRLLRNTVTGGEAHLSAHGLYPTIGGLQNQSTIDEESDQKRQRQIDIIIWILFLADGTNDLLDMVERTGFKFNEIKEVALLLESKGLVAIN